MYVLWIRTEVKQESAPFSSAIPARMPEHSPGTKHCCPTAAPALKTAKTRPWIFRMLFRQACSEPAVRNLCFVWVPRVSLRQGLVHITSTHFWIFDPSVRKNYTPFVRTSGVFLNPLPSPVQTSNMGAPYGSLIEKNLRYVSHV